MNVIVRTLTATALVALAPVGLHTARATAAPPAWPFDGAPAGQVATRDGDLDVLVADLVALMPGPGSGLYRNPTASEAQRLREGVRAVRAGQLRTAAQRVAGLGFRVLRLRDVDTARTLVALGQVRSAWADRRAWGLIVLDPNGSRLSVQAPHPRWDQASEQVAVELFRRSRAGALLVAGAHRFAVPTPSGARWAPADVAHQPGSAFHVAHVALRERGLTTVVQPHGFDGDAHEGDAQAVVSSGTRAVAPVARRVHERLLEIGIASCLFGEGRCGELGGTQNVQGQDTRAAGGQFVHLELVRALRTDASARERVVGAVAAGLTG